MFTKAASAFIFAAALLYVAFVNWRRRDKEKAAQSVVLALAIIVIGAGATYVLVTHNSVMAWTLQPVPCWTRDGC